MTHSGVNMINTNRIQPSKYNHVFWADLEGKGLMQEIIVVAKDNYRGTLWFIPMNALDEVDKRRIFKLVTDRSATMLPLFEVMSNTILGNGVNALVYFHQLTKMWTASGQIVDPNAGLIGAAPTMQVAQQSASVAQPMQQAAPVVLNENIVQQSTPAKRGRKPAAK